MSRWTHPTCEPCFVKRYPDRQPVRLRDPELETCCHCGETTQSGIYTRADPESLRCRGYHHLDEDE